jgi:hypothetical protein
MFCLAAIGCAVELENDCASCTWYRMVGVVSARGWQCNGCQGRQNLRVQNEYFKLKNYVVFLEVIGFLILRTGYSVSNFGLSQAHNFCKAVQLLLLAADTK